MYGDLLQTELKQFVSVNEEDAASVQESLETVEKAARRIEKLINNLRDLARANTAKPELADLRQPIEDALLMVANKLSKGGVEVVQEEPDQECMIFGHDTQVEQVFMNLISNACDAMAEVEEPTLTLRLQQIAGPNDAPFWEFTVTDNGTGIAPGDVDRVFTSFFTTKGKGKGTGLGLAIVQSIIHNHGGDITVTSELGKGTTFSVLLPVCQQTEAAG